MWGLPRERWILSRLWRMFWIWWRHTKNVSDSSLSMTNGRNPTQTGFRKKEGTVGLWNWEVQGQIWLQTSRTLVSKQYSRNQSLSNALFHVGFVPRQALPTPWQMVTFSSRSTWPKSAISVERVSDLEYAEPTPKSLEGQHTKGEAFHSFWISGMGRGGSLKKKSSS